MSASHERIAAVCRLELATQRREPLTVLYVLVLGGLAAAFAGAGPVDLVRDRGTVPRDAAWSVWLAGTALAAFGQVITTMVAAAVVLRDRADRVADLYVATRLTRREYLQGKLWAALVMLALIYAAIPVGLVLGAVVAGGHVAAAAPRVALAFAVLVLPTMLAVGALQFAAGVRSGRLWVIVGQGLLLLWLWSACADAAGHDAPGSGVAAVLDPFGSAPVLLATRQWSDADRAARAVPLTASLLANRALWLVLGAAAAAWAVRAAPAVPVASAAGPAVPADAAARTMFPATVGALTRGQPLPAWRRAWSVAQYVARWLLRDTGWRVLAALGALNVGVHAAVDAGAGTAGAAALAAVLLHARLFLILLATIYAGELVWRERDERSAPLFDALPVGTLAQVMGRLAGAITAQVVLVTLLVGAALVGALAGGHTGIEASTVVPAAARRVLAPFVCWLVLSLAVHVVVQQKAVAHLLCIAAWVSAIALSRDVAMPVGGDRLGPMSLVASLGAIVVAWLGWRRGVPSGRWRRDW